MLTEGEDGEEGGGVVVIEGEGEGALMELLSIIEPLTTQVIHSVTRLVLTLQQSIHVTVGIAVDGLHVLTREAHGDDTRGDVSQV